MTTAPTAETRRVLEGYVALLDAQDWDGLRAALADDLTAHYVHDGQRFDADSLVAYNRDYPGSWRLTAEEVVVEGDRGVVRARVSDDRQAFCVVTFATVREGLISSLDEVWTDELPGPGDPAGAT